MLSTRLMVRPGVTSLETVTCCRCARRTSVGAGPAQWAVLETRRYPSGDQIVRVPSVGGQRSLTRRASSAPGHGGMVTMTNRRSSSPVLRNWKCVPHSMARETPWLDVDRRFGTLTLPPDLPLPGDAKPHLVHRGVDDRHRHSLLRQRAVHHAAARYGDQLANPRTVRGNHRSSVRETHCPHPFLRQNHMDRRVLNRASAVGTVRHSGCSPAVSGPVGPKGTGTGR